MMKQSDGFLPSSTESLHGLVSVQHNSSIARKRIITSCRLSDVEDLQVVTRVVSADCDYERCILTRVERMYQSYFDGLLL